MDYEVSWQLYLYQGGYEGEAVYPDSSSSVTKRYKAGEGGSHSETYYFTDTNYLLNGRPEWNATFLNNNSTKVFVEIEDEWTSRMLENNRIEITITTTIKKIWRGDLKGNPNGSGSTNARNLTVQMGAWNMNWPNLNIAINEDIMPNAIAQKQTFILEPEASRPTPSVYVLNKVVGYTGPGDTDEMGMGTSFRNLLEKGFQHKIIYDPQGGHDGPEDDIWTDKEECTSRKISSIVPKNPHWIWKGWSTNPNATEGTYQPGDTITVCDEVRLYAIWEYTYRPGMILKDGVWWSCDRDGETGPLGRAQILKNGKWIEMRIRTSTTQGLEDPPCIFIGNWRKMNLIGRDGVPHNIKWDCPHEWPEYYS